ncbi:Hypoticical protein [Pectobacterium parmentieri]|uniref:Hypoticical protein n=1 Tax=Pectobacterium parmentieri TaxID=1905730 RepID=A0A0H3I0S2_PECPM|nr:Hypoticical protein [Pectobacterium parmentieri]
MLITFTNKIREGWKMKNCLVGFICFFLSGCSYISAISLGDLNGKNDVCPVQSAASKISGGCA